MNWRASGTAIALLLAMLACGGPSNRPQPDISAEQGGNPLANATLTNSPFVDQITAYGFFPSPPEPTFTSILTHFKDMGEHADFILIQPHIPWQDFLDGASDQAQSAEDIRNQVRLARQQGLAVAFVVDPLNGLNRRELFGLPGDWQATFANPDVRAAFMNFSLWLAREFEPHYLGLASEINTYMDAHPQDVEHYLSLYRETYDAIKSTSSNTNVFVTFQWDDLRNMFPQAAEGRAPGQINWEQVELFEPALDVWAISSYPYFVFNGGEPIPADYYTPLLARTEKPLAVAEGGFSSRPVGPIQVDQNDQAAYLQAVHDQLGGRLSFWVYILLNDLNMKAIAPEMGTQGRSQRDIDTFSLFASVGLRQQDGTPKAALALWDTLRKADALTP